MAEKKNDTDFPHFLNADGQRVFCKYWKPLQDAKALAFIIHGFGEHCQRYEKIVGPLNNLGVFVCGHDHVGHGKSDGARATIKEFSIYARDSLQHVDIIREKHPDLPVFLIAHSMGGTIGIEMANQRPDDFKVVVISPMIMFNPQDATKLMIMGLKAVSLCWGGFPVKKIPSNQISRDPDVAKDYDVDPLNYHGSLKAGFLRELYYATLDVIESLPNIRWPYILQHGTADELCYIGGSQMMFDQSKSSDKTYKIYEGYYHELDKEPEEYAKVVIDDLMNWVSQRLAGEDVVSKEEDTKGDAEAETHKDAAPLVSSELQLTIETKDE